MKLVLLFAVIAQSVLCLPVQGQDFFNSLSPKSIRSINSSDEDYADLQFLKEILSENKIVLLGEQSHGEGATFEAKVRLIKFLHQELNYEIVSFESGLYDNYKAYESINDTSYHESPLKESIFGIWSDSKEFEPLLKYIHTQKNSIKPLAVTGFDCQVSNIFRDEFLNDLKSLLGKSLTLSKDETAILEAVISAGPEFIMSNENDSSLFVKAVDKIEGSLEELSKRDTSLRGKMIKQSFTSWLAQIRWEIDELTDVDIKVQNPRDLQMAKNLIFLSELYPEKKIIGWGASYHFADKIQLFKNTELTRTYINRLDSLQKSDDPTDLDKDLDGAIPMGRILKDHFGSTIYSIAFSSFDGEFGMLGLNSTPIKPIQPPVGSIEDKLVLIGDDYSFINYQVKEDEDYFYSSALGNLPVFAPWHKLFDGLFFIRTSYAPAFVGSAIKNLVEPTQNIVIQNNTPLKGGVKRLIDKETKLGISYGNIHLLNTSRGVASNLNGEFIFNIPLSNTNDKVVFSSIGYKTDTLAIHEFLKVKEIELMPVSYELGDVVIRSKPLKAKEIIKLAEKRISKNYYQKPNQQEFFYRVKKYQEDSVMFNEEAAVMVYNPNGYKSSTNVAKKLKGQILQFRNTTKNEDTSNSWDGVGSLWLLYTHDIILDKDNVLHRPTYYDLTLNGITIYENRKVYDITFDCKRPGAYTTGYGYPSPISASGKIFIDINTYSVLKVETLIQRKSYKNKRRPNYLNDPFGHQLIQTYKEYDGKFFLNYSKQLHYGKWTNTKTNTSNRYLEIRELLSTEISTKPTNAITVGLKYIKSIPSKQDENFWINHNIILEDNIVDSYEFLGLSKQK
jgi:hypothetical protein